MPNPPPLVAPLFAHCPRCTKVLRAKVDLRRRRPSATLRCPWCYETVQVGTASR